MDLEEFLSDATVKFVCGITFVFRAPDPEKNWKHGRVLGRIILPHHFTTHKGIPGAVGDRDPPRVLMPFPIICFDKQDDERLQNSRKLFFSTSDSFV